ncbi:helicase associated domain-containing protein [Streptomyces sp. NPDC047917]|uniref:helicase associated domain-containing protein n=1 Tax=Streptomyces sp. NPDC047917 TaxID=3365491 RepID=UPI00371944B4
MTEARRDELDAIDPGWCPVWDTGWQRGYRLVQNHVRAGAPQPETVGDVVVQGEDLGRWVNAQRYGWEQLLPVQQWILENTLKLIPAEENERPVKQTQDTKWAANLAAAQQFHAREGHLRVPRKHVEHPWERKTARQAVRAALTGLWWSSWTSFRTGRQQIEPSAGAARPPHQFEQTHHYRYVWVRLSSSLPPRPRPGGWLTVVAAADGPAV